MDSAVEKIGVYDFFAVLLSGMICLLLMQYMQIPVLDIVNYMEGEIIRIVFILLEGYFFGIILQEIGAFIDRKIMKLRKNIYSNYLNDKKMVIDNELEFKEFRKIAGEILGENKEYFDEKECEYVYRYCKEYLVIIEKNGKIDRITSIYAMSRSFFTATIFSIIIYAIQCSICKINFDIKILISMFLLLILFYKRAKRFAKYKLQIVLREYRAVMVIKGKEDKEDE